MSEFLLVGSAIGAAIGLVHATILFTQRTADGQSAAASIYSAGWALILWTVFGAYVLLFWLLGAILMGTFRLIGRRAAR